MTCPHGEAEWPGICARDDRHVLSGMAQLIHDDVLAEHRTWRGEGQIIDRVQVIRSAGTVQCWCQLCGESWTREESERAWTLETLEELVAGHSCSRLPRGTW